MNAFDRLGDHFEGKGSAILYAIGALVLAGVLFGVYSWWSGRRTDDARLALGKAIDIAEAPVTPSPSPGVSPTFPSERERAQKAVEEFQQVANKYGDPYREIARHFAAVNLLVVDRPRGIGELEALTKSGEAEVAALSKFALAQARETDGQPDAAAGLYSDLLKSNSTVVPADTLNLRLASVYEKQGKTKEASDILFTLVETARKAQGTDGKPVPPSAAVSDAADKLEKLDPERHAKLTPEQRSNDLPF